MRLSARCTRARLGSFVIMVLCVVLCSLSKLLAGPYLPAYLQPHLAARGSASHAGCSRVVRSIRQRVQDEHWGIMFGSCDLSEHIREIIPEGVPL